jgi:adenosylcobyric acid synthase
MSAKVLMIQGTASSVGKSIIVAALCRIFRQDGYKVAPFKAQNMALNSFVTREGGEIGRAQAVQAEAAGIEPSVHMNPVLLKPEANDKSQVIMLGKVARRLSAKEYYKYTPRLLDTIESSLNHLRSLYDIVIIEGAGSPAEINLKEREIVNMRIARIASAPVLLVGDIDRGGVFASIIGTLQLLTDDERALIKGIIINKFRGDLDLLKPGLEMLEQRCGKPVAGVLPYFRDIAIAQEDSVYLDERKKEEGNGNLQVAIIRLPHISNYDDFDPLEEHGCTVHYITEPREIADCDLIILPGTKSTIPDLVYLQKSGLARAIIEKVQNGIPAIGICGGYQMLGRRIDDPHQVESEVSSIFGLGLLDQETIFDQVKTTVQIKGKVAENRGLLQGMKDIEVSGYEIHMGQTKSRNYLPVFNIVETPEGKTDYYDGATDESGKVFGTYIHGLFHNVEFTSNFLNRLREMRGFPASADIPIDKQANYDKLAKIVRENLDMPLIHNLLQGVL